MKTSDPPESEMAERIRDFDWSTTSLGAAKGWPSSLRTATDMVLASPLVSSLVCGPDRILIYNDASARLYGTHHPEALGRPLPDTFPEGWKTVGPFYERVFGGESVRIAAQPLDTRGDRSAVPDVFDFALIPVRDEGGKVAYAHMVGFEVGDRLRNQAALRESEGRYRALARASTYAVYRMNPQWTDMRVLEGRGFLADTQAPSGVWIEKYILAEDRSFVLEAIDTAIETKSTFDLEHRVLLADGGIGWTHSCAVPLIDDQGRIVEWIGSASDISGRKQAEAALREREADLARVQRIGRVGGLNIDVSNGLLGWRSPEYLRLHGLPQDTREETHERWLDRVHPDDQQNAEQTLLAAVNGDGAAYDSEYRIVRPSDGVVRWIHARADIERQADGKAKRLVGAHLDVTEQKRLQEQIKASEERQAFLLTLSDALRPLDDPEDIQEAAARILAAKLGAGWVYYVEYHEEPPRLIFRGEHRRGDLPSLLGTHAVFSPAIIDRMLHGNVVSIDDVMTSPLFSDESQARWASFGMRSVVGVPILKQDSLITILLAGDTVVRDWSGSVDLIEETAERTWAASERVRDGAALRQSEERMLQFGEASQDVLWIRDAETLRWVYLTPAFERIYGIKREDALGGHDFQSWTELIVPEDREHAVESIARVRAGEHVTFEFRIQRPNDGDIRWLRESDFPITDKAGRVALIGGVGHDITQMKAAEEYQKLLLAELQHRVRNTLSVIRNIVRQTAERSETLEEHTAHLEGRINAFARVQAVVTRNPQAGIELSSIIADELRAAGAREGENATIEGKPLILQPKAAETIGLAIHELATNAVKYGALSARNGRIAIEWTVEDEELDFHWSESGMHDLEPAVRQGFGFEILQRSLPYMLNAKVSTQILPTGLRFDARMPLSAIEKKTGSQLAAA